MCVKILFVSKDASLLSLASEVVTIWGFLYVLPNSIYQLRIQNLSANAGRSMDLVNATEKHLKYFFKEGKQDNKWDSSIANLLLLLNDLRYSLDLLLPNSIIEKQMQWIKETIKMLEDYVHRSDVMAYLESETTGIFTNLNSLRESLKEIHQKPATNILWGVLKDILIFCIVTLALYLIR